jgi:hypothetical protein
MSLAEETLQNGIDPGERATVVAETHADIAALLRSLAPT